MGNISGIYFMEYNTSNFLYKKECGYILYISCLCDETKLRYKIAIHRRRRSIDTLSDAKGWSFLKLTLIRFPADGRRHAEVE